MIPDYTIAVDERFVDGPVVVLFGTGQGTYAGGGGTPEENRWSTPVALRALVENGKVAEWRVYADNEPLRQLMAASRQKS